MADKQDSVTDKASGNQADNLSVFGVPIKTASWVKDDDLLLISPGIEELVYLDGTDPQLQARVTLKKPSWALYHKGKIRLSQQDTRSTVSQDKRGKNATRKPKP